MDQIFFNINPTLKQLVDNAQKSNNLLQKEQEKEVKREKTKITSSVDTTDINTDIATLGNDMLGSMDPDTSKRRKPQQKFKERKTNQLSGEKSESPPESQPDIVKAESRNVENLEKLEVEEKKTPGKEPPEPKSLPETSLLSNFDDFIIADLSKPTEEASENFDDEKLSVENTGEEKHAKKIEEILNEIIISHEEPVILKKLKKMLSKFGLWALSICRNSEIKVILVPTGMKLSKLASRKLANYDDIRMGYIPSRKLCILGDETVSQDFENFSVPVLYFAHALDHALGEDTFASLKSAAIKSNFQACKNQEPCHQFTNYYSSISPVHYFACALESYLQSEVSGGRTCTREELYDLDRSMFMYVEYLMNKQVKQI
ncbi:MAG: hypothetical protein M1536_05185 [Firmicutes bacterium]|nr:hypothetical protein [Bacillota bacterium]